MDLDNRSAETNEAVYIPQHPGGEAKQLAINDSSTASQRCEIAGKAPGCTNWNALDYAYSCDTAEGSSGSPVLSASTHKVIALHHCGALGQCTGLIEGENQGIPVTEFYDEVSAYVYPNNSAAPSSSPVHTAVSNGSHAPAMAPTNNPISATCKEFRVEIVTDRFGSETSWKLEDNSNNLIAHGGNYGNDQAYSKTICLVSNGAVYTFTIEDSFNDGMCCLYGDGSFHLYYDGNLIGSGGQFQSSLSFNFAAN